MSIIKTYDEVRNLRKAAKIGSECFEYICTLIKPGMTEKEIARYIYEFFVKNGASGLSFDTIVGSGINSAQIHSTPTYRIIQENDIILFDMGCIYNGYCSDMSRTVFVGKPTERQEEIYSLVYKTYLNAVNNIKIGNTAKEADLLGRKLIIDNGYNYAHALGHGVGTKVHEDPLISPKREDILKENMVFSVEPGIYLENEFGVRIEDTVLVTKFGCISLTKSKKDYIIL